MHDALTACVLCGSIPRVQEIGQGSPVRRGPCGGPEFRVMQESGQLGEDLQMDSRTAFGAGEEEHQVHLLSIDGSKIYRLCEPGYSHDRLWNPGYCRVGYGDAFAYAC
jgi:hypothetical protein